ncbi:MAG: folate family ECF transporter S component [Clostridiales bacterium]|nr:folate family ECF transporter S component [Clostridiales bacterium]
MKKMSTRMLALLGLFIAISIILARFLAFYLSDSMRVSFEYFSIILAGVCFGPLAGAVVGGVSDFLGATVLSGLGFYPPLLLGPVLAGFLAGVFSKYVFRGRLDRWWKVMTICLVCEIAANLLWGSFALSLMTKTPFHLLLAARAPLKLAIMVIDAQLVFAVHKGLLPLLNHENGGLK